MPIQSHSNRLLAVLIAAAFCAAPALAKNDQDKGDKGDKHGQKHEQKHEDKAEKKAAKHGGGAEKYEHKEAKKGHEPKHGAYFSSRDRDSVRTYYVQHYSGGKACPPGLAKKNNGCLPPGHAKRWNVGQPLPRDVVYHTVPQQVLVLLPPQPQGYRYVSVAGDVLLIAIGTMMVIDGLDGLMRM